MPLKDSSRYITHCGALLSLPNELKEGVIDLIDDTPDILSLALSCRALQNHIIPHHLCYRDVSCSQEGFNGFM
jgi:hypothetical protein